MSASPRLTRPCAPGPDAGVVAIAPVGQVVPALGAGPRQVADLVCGEPVPRARRCGLRIKGGRGVLVRQRDPPPPVHRLERRPGLDGELIQREVVGAESERAVELCPPGRQVLAGPGVDQVERDARKQQARQLERGNGLLGGVLPAEEDQRVRVQALDPERDAVDAGGAEGAEPSRLDAGRVGLERDLEVGRRVEQPGRVCDQVGDGGRVHQARRTATEEDRAERPPSQPRRLPRQLGPQRAGEPGLVDAVAHVAVEVAIGALGQAERPVDIEGKGRHQRRYRPWRTR